MSETLKPCPVCGEPPLDIFGGLVVCQNKGCFTQYREMPPEEWSAIKRAPSEREKRLEKALREIHDGLVDVGQYGKTALFREIARVALEEK